MADILQLCKPGRRKTGVMYRANLSHQMLKFYLWHMVELGLLEETMEMRFQTTEKGEKFLSNYQMLADTLSGLGLTKSNMSNGDGGIAR